MYWLILILVGMLLIMIDILTHPHTLSVFLIFPIVIGEGGILSIIGIILIFLGIISAIFYPLLVIRRGASHYQDYYFEPNLSERIEEEVEESSRRRQEVSWGGFLLIGPIPIFFGSLKRSKYSKYMFPITLLLGVMLTLLAIMFIFKYYLP